LCTGYTENPETFMVVKSIKRTVVMVVHREAPNRAAEDSSIFQTGQLDSTRTTGDSPVQSVACQMQMAMVAIMPQSERRLERLDTEPFDLFGHRPHLISIHNFYLPPIALIAIKAICRRSIGTNLTVALIITSTHGPHVVRMQAMTMSNMP
jgi:hypothetical protein